jgi:hypothetical protein
VLTVLPDGDVVRPLTATDGPALAAAYLFIADGWRAHVLHERILHDRPV